MTEKDSWWPPKFANFRNSETIISWVCCCLPNCRWWWCASRLRWCDVMFISTWYAKYLNTASFLEYSVGRNPELWWTKLHVATFVVKHQKTIQRFDRRRGSAVEENENGRFRFLFYFQRSLPYVSSCTAFRLNSTSHNTKGATAATTNLHATKDRLDNCTHQ